ncbi:MAG: adenylate/guanylate cyclase domain-containing protein [Pseudomonadales bacterium]|nr:adenylate/guanylate cyclase domain-containing protein [Pseudomonadales bacterium]
MSASNYAVMFADIAGSSSLYKQIGDEPAKKAIFSCLALAENIICAHRGIVVKTIGDEIMARFDDPNDAIESARNLQMQVDQNFSFDGAKMAMRIGVHYGPAILENNDIFGDAVNTAARMVSAANARQIVLSEPTVHALAQDLCALAHRFDFAKIKAFKESVPLYLIEWEATMGNVTTLMPVSRPATAESKRGFLVLQFEDQKHAVTADQTDYTIGREAQCDLVVPSPFASRKHAWVEYRRGKFVLVDHSANGTWVRTGDNQDIFLKREELPLWGAGAISLGEPLENNVDYVIKFSL